MYVPADERRYVLTEMRFYSGGLIHYQVWRVDGIKFTESLSEEYYFDSDR